MSQFYDKIYRKMCQMGDRHDIRQQKRLEFCTLHCNRIVLSATAILCLLVLLGMKLLPETVTVMYNSKPENAEYYARNVFIIRYAGLEALAILMFSRKKQFLWLLVMIALLLAFGLHVFIGS